MTGKKSKSNLSVQTWWRRVGKRNRTKLVFFGRGCASNGVNGAVFRKCAAVGGGDIGASQQAVEHKQRFASAEVGEGQRYGAGLMEKKFFEIRELDGVQHFGLDADEAKIDGALPCGLARPDH